MTNKTKQTILIIILCVLVFMLIVTINVIARAESLDTAEVTELRIATTDCAYSMRPMGDVAEEVKAGDTVYVIRAYEYEGHAGPTEYVLCNTENGLRWLWGGFTGYKVNAEGRESPLGGAPIETTPEGGTIKTVTAYCSACDHTGITASGKPLAWGRVASNDYPIGTRLYIDGYGECVVEDRMRDSGKVDVYLGERDVCSCGSEWGRRQIAVRVIG